MKGQYKVISQILIFAIGIAVAGFVLISFDRVGNVVHDASINDGLVGVSDIIVNAISRAVQQDGTNITIQIPKKIGDTPYTIAMNATHLILKPMGVSSITVSREVFNIDAQYTVISIPSSAEFIDISFSNNNVGMKRSEKIQRGVS
ncbi:MAG: hypothetical protein HY832_03040 [Candidatus Aenigmarchaeota archaeon]|nr:hypothetical protein [Candidatus Aenigmarchaeota archaeon]